MNDARWLGQWVAQQVKAPPAEAEIEALAKQAERAAARDGFSVDDALGGLRHVRAFVLKSRRRAPDRHRKHDEQQLSENTGFRGSYKTAIVCPSIDQQPEG